MGTSRLKESAGRVFLCLLLCVAGIRARALASEKENPSLSHYIMAVMYDRLGELEKAVDEYKKALKADQENSAIHLGLAATYIKSEKLNEAILELNLATSLEPEAVEPHAMLALLYILENKLELATREYEIALKNASKLDPENIDIYKSLALVYLQQKRYPEAKGIYDLIIGFTPNDPEAHFYLGDAYYKLNDKKKGEAELKKALELKSDYAEALNYLGYVYVEENRNFSRAESLIKKALEIDAFNGAYIDSLGWLYFKRGKIKEALKELERAAILLEDPEIYDHLGEVYLKLNNPQSARLNWEKSLKLDPEQPKIKEKLEKSAK